MLCWCCVDAVDRTTIILGPTPLSLWNNWRSFVKVLASYSNSVAMVRGRLQEHGRSARISDRQFFLSMHYYFVQKKLAANGLYCIHRFQEQCCYGAFPLRFCCDACDSVVSNLCIVTDQFSSGLVHFLLGKIQICIVTLQHCNFNACSYFP